MHTIPYVRGRTVSLSGKRWATHARISVSTAGMDKPEAKRTLAIAAGRRYGTHGTTKGAEGRTHAFSRTKAALKQLIVRAADDLTEGLN